MGLISTQSVILLFCCCSFFQFNSFLCKCMDKIVTRHEKTDFKVVVDVIPKEGLAGSQPANLSLGLTTTKTLRSVFSWHMSNGKKWEDYTQCFRICCSYFEAHSVNFTATKLQSNHSPSVDKHKHGSVGNQICWYFSRLHKPQKALALPFGEYCIH